LRKFLILCAGVSLAGTWPLAAQVPAAAETAHRSIYPAANIEWKAGPDSLPAGAQFALLEGSLSKAGYFALQIRLPDGYVIPPHWHPVQERVTVLSGTFRLGHGDVLDRQQTQALPAGSYFCYLRK
jgi:quercetin dioxygenase-like cupin family protein